MNKKVLLTVDGNCPYMFEMEEMLRAEGIEPKQADLTRVDLEGLSEQASDCSSVIACAETYNDAVFDRLPNLKCIVKSGVGLDAIDIDSATRHGVVVSNTPGANGSAVAEMAVAMMLSMSRRIVHYHNWVMEGHWKSDTYSNELSEQTVGLVGFGYIARTVAKYLSGFGCKIIAYDIKPDIKAAEELHVEFTSFENVLSNADIISLHAPLTDETRGYINRDTIEMMKPGAILVNTSRGGVVNEDDLYEALRSQRIAAAALDVTGTEPLSLDSPLRTLNNIQLSPHKATSTYEAMRNLHMACAVQIIQYYRGEEIDHTVNPGYKKYL